ncbi:MAG: ATP-binding protein [Chloroflexaceae bacterium]
MENTATEVDIANYAFFQGFLTHSSAVMFAKDLDGRYLLVNKLAAALGGLSPDDIIGKTDAELLPNTDFATQVNPNDQRVIATGEAIEFEETFVQDDEVHTYLTVKFPIRDAQGQIIALGGIATDITARKQAEAALYAEQTRLEERVATRTAELAHAVRAKDEFLATMSHELRTPLNAILGLSEALQEGIYGALSSRQCAPIQTIAESGQHLLTLINDILDLAKIESGKESLSRTTILVEQVCHNSIQMVRHAAQKKHIRINEFLQVEESIQADVRRLTQILVNLLSNAVKFTPEGGSIGLEVTTDTAHNQIHFTVWDTGIGIAPEYLEHLFQPFTQIESGLNRAHTGTGLGLALVKRLTTMHGGNVTVTSEVGQGSHFTVTLPLQSNTTHDSSTSIDESAVPVHDLVNPPHNILIADDNDTSIEMLTDYLRMHGYRVSVAHTGGEVLQCVTEDTPALILMDIQMPGIDGMEATRRIRTMPGISETPIIALTALAMPGDEERCMDAGATAYLSKPVSLRKLATLIDSILK